MPESVPSSPPEAVARRRRLRITLGVVAVAVVAFLAVVLLASSDSPSPSVGRSGAATETSAESSSNGAPASRAPQTPVAYAMGDPEAKVLIIEWLDMRCPFCALFARTSMKRIEREYIDKGLVRFEVRDVAFFGAQSAAGGAAARAAGEQGRYLEYMHALYAAAPDRGHPDLPIEKLVGFARQAKVPNLETFTRRAQSPELIEAVNAGTGAAQQLGVTSVPFLIIGRTTVAGAQPWPVIRKAIDGQLRRAGA